ncbi:unnamed protein product [Periconia digitata]|uniref:Uncharacterized protein n=1 Tax=Periconia digitata TaxID=1303443 RepID=A0A9W4UDJ4_9PLEO|nr:unnamed protein product [Periconia digitata]
MTVSTLLQVLSLSSLAFAGPFEKNVLSKRDPCDGVNATPVLYHKYGTDKCPPKFKVDSRGKCYLNPNDHWPWQSCTQFCQQETEFKYTQEKPFTNAYCHGPQTCTISSTTTRTITANLNFNAKFVEAYGIGITGGFSESKATASARAFSVKLEQGDCGYFTFVPVMKRTCGKIGAPTSCSARPNIDEDSCAEQLHRDSDGSVDGETIFVRTDCGTRMPLAKDKQDPVYQKPGVPMDRGLQEAFAQTFKKDDVDGVEDKEIKCSTSDSSPELDTCLKVLESAASYPDLWVSAGSKNKSWWFTYQTGCAVSLNYKSDWLVDGPDGDVEKGICGMTHGDALIASLGIVDKCSKDGKIGGKRPFGRGKCEGELEFIVPKGLPPNGS